MSPQDVREYVDERPFKPFRITRTDGRTYDIRHPEMAMVGYTSVVVGLLPESKDDLVFERVVQMSLDHIMQIETIDVPQRN